MEEVKLASLPSAYLCSFLHFPAPLPAEDEGLNLPHTYLLKIMLAKNGPLPGKSPVSFSIWPPTQRTRDAVIARLIEMFTAPSILSQRYRSIPQDEADKEAHRIEREAYESVANSSATEDDDIEVLQTYSKEISKRMLEVIKGRSVVSRAADDNSIAETAAVDPSDSVTDENTSTANTESCRIC